VQRRQADMPYSRRGAVKLSLAALVPGVFVQGSRPQQEDTSITRLYRPDLAGRPRDRITDYENDPFIIGVEERLRCTCGCNLDVYTCRTTDFSCGTSPAMHREVVALVEQGRTGEEILEAFIAKHGEAVLMAPKKEGFNLAAYFLPGAAISVVGAGLALMLWRRSGKVAEAAATTGGPVSGMSPEEAAKLEDELSRLEP